MIITFNRQDSLTTSRQASDTSVTICLLVTIERKLQKLNYKYRNDIIMKTNFPPTI